MAILCQHPAAVASPYVLTAPLLGVHTFYPPITNQLQIQVIFRLPIIFLRVLYDILRYSGEPTQFARLHTFNVGVHRSRLESSSHLCDIPNLTPKTSFVLGRNKQPWHQRRKRTGPLKWQRMEDTPSRIPISRIWYSRWTTWGSRGHITQQTRILDLHT